MTASTNSYNYALTRIGSARVLENSQIRSLFAKRVGVSPFSVEVTESSIASGHQLYFVKLRENPSIAIPPSKPFPYMVTRLKQGDVCFEPNEVSRYLTAGLKRINSIDTESTGTSLFVGRPLVMAGHIKPGHTDLFSFTYDDWSMYQFDSEEKRQHAFSRYQLGQRWLSDIHKHMQLDVREHKGSPMAIALRGAAFG